MFDIAPVPSSQTYPPYDADARRYVATEGCVVASAVFGGLVQQTEETGTMLIPPTALDEESYDPNNWGALGIAPQDEVLEIPQNVLENPAGVSLWLATTQSLSATFNILEGDARYEDFSEFISVEQLSRAAKTFTSSRLTDLSFTFEFSAALANAAVSYAVREGVISKEERDTFQLNDWADVIDTLWFRRMVHSLAYTGPAILRVMHSLENYADGEFEADLRGKLGLGHVYTTASGESSVDTHDTSRPVFKLSERDNGVAALHGITIEIHPEAEDRLRRIMRASKRAGCPVAREVITLDKSFIESDKNAKTMASEGAVIRDGDDRTTIRLKHTAIDVGLAYLSKHLRSYQDSYGVPHAKADEYGRLVVAHE